MYLSEASEESLNRVAAISSIGLSAIEYLQSDPAILNHYIGWMQGRCAESGMDPEVFAEEHIRHSIDHTREDFERINTNAQRHLGAIDRARELFTWIFS